uniref:Uncharacterized protein LOC100181691 n=1 Tax=Phallusia mammillata TaxID=59560 RepID=A0A6F9DGT3_9ASCI|nr:uncharacterized protein LOC100181691 [Phallusia mammillata]
MYCPSGCQNITERLWGTGIYTDGSYICAAAIHDGAITDFGGVVTLYRGGAMAAFFSSTQNGITSKSYSWWYASVSFIDLCGQQGDQLQFSDEISRSFTCPSNCQESSSNVWGTGIYTKNSHVCAAAIHSGSIPVSGGQITVYNTVGLPSYLGSEQNGIISQTYGSWRDSFSFDNPCTRQADHLDFNGFNSTFFPCPPGCQNTTSRLWGTDIYTDDSYICAAAMHSSQIIGSKGGLVQVRKRGPQNIFTSSVREGVTSKTYGAWPSSFSLLGN